MEWRVGVLRSGAENVAWSDQGDEPDWASARAAALASLRWLAVREGPQEFVVQVGDVEAIEQPVEDEEGRLDLSELGVTLPLSR